LTSRGCGCLEPRVHLLQLQTQPTHLSVDKAAWQPTSSTAAARANTAILQRIVLLCVLLLLKSNILSV